MGGAEGLLAVFVSVRPLLVTVESLQNPPPIAPNMSLVKIRKPEFTKIIHTFIRASGIVLGSRN